MRVTEDRTVQAWALDRVRELLALYSEPSACAADLLCDRRDPTALAYRIVGADLSATDISNGELRAESERFAAALARLGIGPGDRVATLMGKGRDYLGALMGIWRLGAVHVPLFTAFAPPAIVFRLTRSAARLIICDEDQHGKLAPGEDIPADAPWQIVTTGRADGAHSFAAMMAAEVPGFPAARIGGDAPIIHIFTSGTTGSPKGVVVPLRALASFRAYGEFALDLRADDLYWCAADPGWAYGLYFGVLASLATGTPSLMVAANFAAHLTFEVLSSQPVTNFSGAPTIYRAMREAGSSLSRSIGLRCASSAGEPLTPDVNAWAEQALGVEVRDHYGQTETGMLINNHNHPSLRMPVKAGSMGQPMPGWRAVVLHDQREEELAANQVGRIAMDLADSPLAWFGGYDGHAGAGTERFAGSGRWYLTGDIGLVDDDGYFHFSARDDDVIIMAGYRIGPVEIESVLCAHPAVAESAVIAVPDTVRGEVMEAFTVLRVGFSASPELERELKGWVKARYAAHAYPRAVHFIDALPKTPSGKTQRYVLKQHRRDEIDRNSKGEAV
jgi:acetyl-CoA synthetase